MASKYFGEGFDFCKRQIACHHPDIGIDLQGMGIDIEMLEEEKTEAKEREENEERDLEKDDERDLEKDEEKDGEKGNTSPISP